MGSKHIPIEEVTPNGTMTKFLKNYVAGINFGSTLNSHISQHIRNQSTNFILEEIPMSLLFNTSNGALIRSFQRKLWLFYQTVFGLFGPECSQQQAYGTVAISATNSSKTYPITNKTSPKFSKVHIYTKKGNITQIQTSTTILPCQI